MIRLDKYLTSDKKIESRNKSQSLIRNGLVLVNKQITLNPNYIVKEGDVIEISYQNHYVSRAAYKLIEAINSFKIDFKDKVILDIGSSTGGFVQVALENNCKYIYAIDVGTNQLHKSLKEDVKVKSIENTNFRNVTNDLFDKKIDIITCDVSFISSKIILKKICELFKYKVNVIMLLKPQFEIGKELSDKYKGFVPLKYHEQIIKEYKEFCDSLDVKIINIIDSPILGNKLNNKEYLLEIEINHEK